MRVATKIPETLAINSFQRQLLGVGLRAGLGLRPSKDKSSVLDAISLRTTPAAHVTGNVMRATDQGSVEGHGTG